MKFNSIRQPATTYVKLCELFSYNFLENYTIFLYNSSEQKHSIEKMFFKVKNIAKRVHCLPKFYLYSIAIIKSLSQICVFCTFQFKSPYLHKAQRWHKGTICIFEGMAFHYYPKGKEENIKRYTIPLAILCIRFIYTHF